MIFSEAIAVKKNELFNIEYHNKRLNRTRKVKFGIADQLELSDFIDTSMLTEGQLYKCRVLYNEKIRSVVFLPYTPVKVKSLKVVDGGNISYAFKNADRRALNNLFEKRGNCDDIIITKNNYITDASSSNIIFFDGEHWVTPNTPLLKGTRRQALLDSGKIKEAIITINDLKKFNKIMLINAMLPFDEKRIIVDLSKIQK